MEKIALSITSKYGSRIGSSPFGEPSIGTLITNTLDAAIAIGGVIALFLFITAGYQIITSAGSSDPKRHSQGTQTMTYAIIGFVITFASYWIIRFLEILLGADFISSSPF